jgi:hypothetical protein
VVSNREPHAAGRNESLCKEVPIYEDTWLTPKAHDDLEAHMSDVQKLQRMLLKLENYGDVHPPVNACKAFLAPMCVPGSSTKPHSG